MRAFVAFVLLISAACSLNPGPGAARLAGSYTLASINGRAMPTPSPSEPEVMLQGGSLVVERGGRFTLNLNAQVRSQPAAADAAVRGTYRVQADTIFLTLQPPTSGSPTRFRFRMDDGRLKLRDDQGHEFEFTRTR